MKIALFSDIHANLPAFEAFLADLDSRKPDAVYCLGDLVGYNVWPNEIIEGVRKRGIATIAGNHDLYVKNLLPVAPELLDSTGKDYAYHIIKPENRTYLLTLPAHILLDYSLNNEDLRILLVHGSPRDVNEYVLEDTEESYVLDLMNESGADILCVGHSHKPFHRIIQAGNKLKHVINLGSAGKPKDDIMAGCYVMLTLNENSAVNHPDSLQIDFIRFDYDVEKAANAIEESPLPDEFAERLRMAY
ncbi:metallophosphoesterase family protein [Daejeonella sp. H1SJ63]|uniref:metallophosphoesterase family protein n=1 Tax=Daejeonella sp. H1SJ63 TaxID=3034145 RepID=UPI0023EE274E|nr:metallophosphoesterase family protein [Daejeonella sp. H1SJ63]